MNLQSIKNRAKSEGVIWLGGEMEFPANSNLHEAIVKTNDIAEACGYVAHARGTRLTISGGDIPGYVVLDWFNNPEKGPQKIELWTEGAVYLNED